jgi:hypothetical protein
MTSMSGFALALVALSFGRHSVRDTKSPCAAPASATHDLERIRAIVSGDFDSAQAAHGSSNVVPTAQQTRVGDSLLHEDRLHDSLPSAPASAVHLVREKTVCTAAIAAINREYQAFAARGAPPWVAKSVIVIEVGDVYLVADPSDKRSEWRAMFVFTRDFSRLKVSFGI